MRSTLYILLFTLFLPLISDAQSPERIKELADRYFDEFSYDRAIRFYEELPRKSPQVQRNLAQSYVKLNQPEKAEPILFDVVNGNEFQAEDLFNYSQVLAMNKKYPESVKWMTMYHEQQSSDTRAEKVVEEPDYYIEIQAEESKFEIANLEINSPEEDFGATYYKDKVVFASSRTGVETVIRRWNWNQLAFLDMYVADSVGRSQLAKPRKFTKKFNKKFHEGPATFDRDGNVMIYTTNNYKGRSSKGEVNLQLFETRFEGEEWSDPIPLPYNSKEYSVGHASLTADGQRMYFVSDMPGGKGGADIYTAVRMDDGTWGEAQTMGMGINTEGNEMFPFIQNDSILFFASDGLLGIGGLDIFFIDFRHDGVPRPKNIKLPVNSSMDDFALIMNDDRTAGFFSSNREGGKGDDDIYSFTLPKPMDFNRILRGKVVDENGELIANANISLLKNGENVAGITTGEDGSYEFEVVPDSEYELRGAKKPFSDGTNYVDLENEQIGVVYSDLMLTKGITRISDKAPVYDIFADYMHISDDGLFVQEFTEETEGMSIYTLVQDVATGEPVSGAKVTVTDRRTGREEVFYTPETGDHTRAMDERTDFQKGDDIVKVEREGYRTLEFDYSPALDKPGQYRQMISIIPEQYAQDAKVEDRFDISPIYFDLDKYDIREDASLELDKIVELMMKMPDMIIELTSHTDCRANMRYNDRLSNNRAVSTAKYIQGRIDNPQRIYGEGRGELMLANDCACEGEQVSECPEEEHQENRRTEFRIIRF